MVRHPRGRYIVNLVAVSGVATPENRFGKFAESWSFGHKKIIMNGIVYVERMTRRI